MSVAMDACEVDLIFSIQAAPIEVATLELAMVDLQLQWLHPSLVYLYPLVVALVQGSSLFATSVALVLMIFFRGCAFELLMLAP
jgi:hypothetical protein